MSYVSIQGSGTNDNLGVDVGVLEVLAQVSAVGTGVRGTHEDQSINAVFLARLTKNLVQSLVQSLATLAEIVVATEVAIRSIAVLVDGHEVVTLNTLDSVNISNKGRISSEELELQQAVEDVVAAWGRVAKHKHGKLLFKRRIKGNIELLVHALDDVAFPSRGLDHLLRQQLVLDLYKVCRVLVSIDEVEALDNSLFN